MRSTHFLPVVFSSSTNATSLIHLLTQTHQSLPSIEQTLFLPFVLEFVSLVLPYVPSPLPEMSIVDIRSCMKIAIQVLLQDDTGYQNDGQMSMEKEKEKEKSNPQEGGDHLLLSRAVSILVEGCNYDPQLRDELLPLFQITNEMFSDVSILNHIFNHNYHHHNYHHYY